MMLAVVCGAVRYEVLAIEGDAREGYAGRLRTRQQRRFER